MAEFVEQRMDGVRGVEIVADGNGQARAIPVGHAVGARDPVVDSGSAQREADSAAPNALGDALDVAGAGWPLVAPRGRLRERRAVCLADIEHVADAETQDPALRLGVGVQLAHARAQDGDAPLALAHAASELAPAVEAGNSGRIRPSRPDQQDVAKAVPMEAPGETEIVGELLRPPLSQRLGQVLERAVDHGAAVVDPLAGGPCLAHGVLPGWPYRRNSPGGGSPPPPGHATKGSG